MRESWREEIWKCNINKKDPPQGDDIPWLCIKKVEYQPSYCSAHKYAKNNAYPKK